MTNEAFDRAKWKQQFGVDLSIRYYSKRRQWFNFWDKVANFIALAGGSAAVVGGLGGYPAASWVAGVFISVVTIAQIVFDFRGRAAFFCHQLSEFTELKIQLSSSSLTQEGLDQITARRIDLEQSDEETKLVLDAICRNETIRAFGCPREEMRHITPAQRFWCHFFDYEIDKLLHQRHEHPVATA